MKRSLLSLAAIAALPIVASAQSATSGAININATVASAVTITSVGAAALDLNGGSAMTPGTAYSIAPQGAAAAGAYQAKIQTNTPVQVKASANSVNLTNGSGGTLPVAVTCANAGAQDAAATTAIADCNAGWTTGAATAFYFLGVSVTAANTTAAPAGVYSGTVTLNYTWTAF